MGLGSTIGLTLIGIFRELLGAGTIFGKEILPDSYEPITIFVLAPGAFFVLACLTALQNKFKMPSATNKGGASNLSCGGNCATCAGDVYVANHGLIEAEKAEKKAEAAAKAKELAKRKAEEAAKAKEEQAKEEEKKQPEKMEKKED